MLQPAALGSTPARQEDEADRKAFGNVVDRDRDAITRPSVVLPNAAPTPIPSVTEWTVITTTIRSAFRASSPLSVPREDRARGTRSRWISQHEARSRRDPERPAKASVDSLRGEADGGSKHYPGGDRIRRPEHRRARSTNEEQRQRPEASRQRGQQRNKEDGDDVRLHLPSLCPLAGALVLRRAVSEPAAGHGPRSVEPDGRSHF